MVEMISRFREAREQFVETEGRPPSTAELAEKLQMTESKVNHIRSAVKAVSTPGHDTSTVDGQSLTEGIPDNKTPGPDKALLHQSESTRIIALLEDLEERESKILRLRYGLEGDAPMTLKEIGVKINLTRERVRQIECEALRKIKEHLLN
jgi:RNA polymerase primary sigma factor